ncbi:MAG: TolC family protein [Gammaproteobacteria bacterium]|nr:TolC family protein [Gammaproteobacteria bacterium]
MGVFLGISLLVFTLAVGLVDVALAKEGAHSEQKTKRKLPLDEFIRLASARDTEFELILIDELVLKYQKGLRLPAADLILSVKQEYETFISQGRQSPQTTVGLSRLFPFSGTNISLSYGVGASLSSADKISEAALTITQPIARNAFGRSTRLLDKIVGMEIDVVRHQIAEAYEDYLAAISVAYHTWYEDDQNLRIGRSSYNENRKLLDNMRKRQKEKIALPIDVNKIKLQVLAKKQTLVELEFDYDNSLEVIKRIIRYKSDQTLVPVRPSSPTKLDKPFKKLFASFSGSSRTFRILKKLEKTSTLEVAREADDLLPSIDLVVGYEVRGNEYRIGNSDNVAFAGISMVWPLPNQVARAEHAVSKIAADKTRLNTENTYYKLYTQLINLHQQIEREAILIKLANEQVGLAREVVKDEKENYTLGRATLNDFILAVNALDTKRFSSVFHTAQHNKLLVEWLRLTDRLIKQKEVLPSVGN